MKLDYLKPLLTHDGPLTTVCLDVTRGEEAGNRELISRWNSMRHELEHKEVPEETVNAIEELVLRPTHVSGPHGRYIVASGDRILFDHVLAEPPLKDEAFHDGVLSILPAAQAADEAVHYLLVQVDHLGADLSWSGTESHQAHDEVDHVEGGHDVLHKFGGGGWSHRRFQERVNDSWERNAEAVAAELDRVTLEQKPEVILLTGDVRSVALVRKAVGREVSELLVEVPGGPRADGVNEDAFGAKVHDVLEIYLARRREEIAEKVREALGRGDGAVSGLACVVEVLRRGQVAELVITRNAAGNPVADLNSTTLWVGSDPMQLALTREELDALGVQDGEAKEVPAEDALLRAALAEDSGITFVMEGSVQLDDGIGALLRWTDASTPS